LHAGSSWVLLRVATSVPASLRWRPGTGPAQRRRRRRVTRCMVPASLRRTLAWRRAGLQQDRGDGDCKNATRSRPPRRSRGAMKFGPGDARGILRRLGPVGRFQHARHPPLAPLGAFVQYGWIVRWDLRGEAPQLQETLPHPNVYLVFEKGVATVNGVAS